VRSIPRKSLVAGLATAIALGASGTALASGQTDQRFDLTSAVSPNLLDDEKMKPTALMTQVSFLDLNNTPVTPAFGAEEIRLDFDDDIKIATKKLPTCDTDPAVLATQTTQQAVDGCGKKTVIGSGNAKVRFAGFAGFDPEAQELNLTVTAFHGPESVAGPTECADTALGGPFNCEWVGEKPTLYLHARSEFQNQTSLVRGEIQDSGDTLPGTGTPAIDPGYENRLAVTDGADPAGDAGAVALFNAVIDHEYEYQQSGKKKKASVISARCNQTGAAGGPDDVDQLQAGFQAGLQYKGQIVWGDDDSHGGTETSIDTDRVHQYCAS
jgi:hypothetical protein